MKSALLLALFFIYGTGQTALAQHVYKTPSGKKYHLATCRMVENVSEKISLPRAVEMGLEPCKICRPPVMENALPPGEKKAQGTNQTQQCKGTTKAGTRCKHMTGIGDGYCYQHRPG